MLGKLRLPDTPTAHKVQELALLLRHLVEVSLGNVAWSGLENPADGFAASSYGRCGFQECRDEV